MKTILKTVLFTVLSLSFFVAKAQEVGGEPSVKVYDQNNLKFKVGGRFMADGAYYHTDYTKMNSGLSIVEARIRTSFEYKQWYFYADFDFAKEKTHQKNIFLRYNFDKTEGGQHSIKAGYFNEPSTMALNTSKYNLHFLTRASGPLALSAKRGLGITYKYYDDTFFFDQGIFAEDKYNKQEAGSQGFSVAGRWIYRPFKDKKYNAHIGVSARFAQVNTGEQNDNVLKTDKNYSSVLETKVDGTTEFLNAELPWAHQTLDLGVEALFYTDKVFVRGEYLFNRVFKDRPDEKLFNNQLGGLWSWTTLESWQAGNPLSPSSFDAFYIELGKILKGGKYSYNKEYSTLGGSNVGDLELVARYSYTNLNDIKEGDFYFIGKDRFYNGQVSDYPATSTSIGGGKLQTGVIGLNYTFNKFTKVMCAYQYSHLNNVRYPNDKNFHTLQARLMFSF